MTRDVVEDLFAIGPNSHCLREKPLSTVNNYAECYLPFSFWSVHNHKLLISLCHYSLKVITSFNFPYTWKIKRNTNFRNKTHEYFLSLSLLAAIWQERHGSDKMNKKKEQNRNQVGKGKVGGRKKRMLTGGGGQWEGEGEKAQVKLVSVERENMARHSMK